MGKVYKSVNSPLPFLCLKKFSFLQTMSANLSYTGPHIVEAGSKSYPFLNTEEVMGSLHFYTLFSPFFYSKNPAMYPVPPNDSGLDEGA